MSATTVSARLLSLALLVAFVPGALSAAESAAPVAANASRPKSSCPWVWRGSFGGRGGQIFSLTESATGRSRWVAVGEKTGDLTVTGYDATTQVLSLRAAGRDYAIHMASEVVDTEPEPTLEPRFMKKSQLKIEGLDKLTKLNSVRRKVVLKRLAVAIAAFDAEFKSASDEFEAELADPENKKSEHPLERGSAADPGNWEKRFTVDVSEAPGASLSVFVDEWEHTGGAHGNSSYSTLSFIGDSDAPSSADDLLIGNPESLGELSKLADAALLKSGYKVGDDNRDGLAPTKENFSHVMLTLDGIRLRFPPYQIGPYSDGDHTVNIPASRLSGVVQDKVLRALNKPASNSPKN